MSSLEQLEQLMKGLTPMCSFTKEYIKEASKLARSATVWRVCSFDDTLFSRQDQIANEPLLQGCKDSDVNKTIKYRIGIPYVIGTYYVGKDYPQEIIKELVAHRDIILTAGFIDFQQEKAKILGLSHIKMLIVSEADDKILRLIQYVLYTLKNIPAEIIIYEDTPKYFLQYRELIEGILGNKLTIMHVEMDGNTGYKRIEKII